MKLKIRSLSPVSDEDMERNEAHAKALGFPRMGVAGTPNLAIVGGGSSIADRLDEIRSFDGDVWAVNGAWRWCYDHGVDSRFFSLDPSEKILPFCIGASSAMLSMGCHPAVFDALIGAGVEAVSMRDGLIAGPTTATSAPLIALKRGYRSVSFFGCESSFGSQTHVYGNYNLPNLMKVSCDGREFLTTTDMMMQAEYLGELIRAFPSFLFDRSGGLLSAYVASPDIDAIAATQSIHDAIEHDCAVRA